jgi:glycosyltransferase involved in cell wall biosynthesis
MISIKAFFPLVVTGKSVSYTCLSLCEHLGSDDCAVQLWAPRTEDAVRRDFCRDGVPGFAVRVTYRLWGAKGLQRLAERRFGQELREGDIAYLWPGSSLWLYQRARDRGALVVTERINCHTAFARRELNDAYQRLGKTATHGLTDRIVDAEREELSLCDYVFSPSPAVTRSLQAEGVATGKILPASFGWDPNRVRKVAPAERAGGLNVLFVGWVCVRKGAHLLAQAWAEAKVPGQLILAGTPEPDLADICGGALARPDVVCLGHTEQIGPIFGAADVFAFPSLEEGSPLVVYEAMGCGLPVVVSPMAAGDVVRDGVEGFVRDPYDKAGWIAALRMLADDADLRRQMSAAAARRADEYTWDHVARRRRTQLAGVAGKLEGRASPQAADDPMLAATP